MHPSFDAAPDFVTYVRKFVTIFSQQRTNLGFRELCCTDVDNVIDTRIDVNALNAGDYNVYVIQRKAWSSHPRC